MSTLPANLDEALRRAEAGERLANGEIATIAGTADVLSLGMIADAVRRHLHDERVTYLRVAPYTLDAPVDTVPAEAREVRLSGAAPDRRTLLAAVERARAAAGDRVVSGLSWTDVVRIAADAGGAPGPFLKELRSAGLEAIAAVPIDDEDAAVAAIDALLEAGFSQLRITFGEASSDRLAVALRAAALQDRFGAIRALNPLPPHLRSSGPSTGFDDVKTVALSRIAAPNIMTIQVDWQRYGPKLAQVALTFGADDLDSVPAVDESTHGPRRALIAEVRRNIEAASFVPAERDGRFNRVE